MKRSILSYTKETGLVACVIAVTACQSNPNPSCSQYGNLIGSATLPQLALQRLDDAPKDNFAREALATEYLSDYCEPVISYEIRGSKHNSYTCRVTGQKDTRILIGAHYDKSEAGSGVADNWSGVVVVSELLHYLSENPPRNTFEFALFGEEEPGMKGSKTYLEDNTSRDLVAMFNVDTLGLGPTRIDARSDLGLGCLALNSGKALGLPINRSNLRRATGDWQPFARVGVRILNFHSLNSRNIRVLHSWRDSRRAVDDNRLKDSYQLILNTVMSLDSEL